MAAIQVESPGVYDESLHDQEDLVYPCKGCGEILEEGKAFELGKIMHGVVYHWQWLTVEQLAIDGT
ncbi:hypothetical protein BTJ68_08293 [Hortaea werneckii EXF-2000]|uniref:Uncharacterized protein n=1 Tax=Hortaea werneckii EXF-2000 TaxID=1157616 RepID=A0A1Z5T910_HORWE|nr:hypothetical protein BTJ68_08293 [Hortaea werneckii EXF-2000]